MIYYCETLTVRPEDSDFSTVSGTTGDINPFKKNWGLSCFLFTREKKFDNLFTYIRVIKIYMKKS
jgi:hypothetical protein